MKIKFKAFLILGLIMCSGFIRGNSRRDAYKEFLKGIWVADSKDLNSLIFMENAMINIVTRKNNQNHGINMHYRIVEDQTNGKSIKLQLLYKDLYKDDFDEKGIINLSVKNNEELILHSKNSGDIQLIRKIIVHESR